MRVTGIGHLFASLNYEKSSQEIIDKCEEKKVKVQEKIETRTKRITKIREDYEIDDAALVHLLDQLRQNSKSSTLKYMTSNAPRSSQENRLDAAQEREIAAGVVNNLMTERDQKASEEDQVKELNAIIRNLRPITRYTRDGEEYQEDSFRLEQIDMEYLGF